VFFQSTQVVGTTHKTKIENRRKSEKFLSHSIFSHFLEVVEGYGFREKIVLSRKSKWLKWLKKDTFFKPFLYERKKQEVLGSTFLKNTK